MFSFVSKKILCVVAHPDDEVLGCGGTIARAAQEGADVGVLLTLQRRTLPNRETWENICTQFVKAVETLGATPIIPQQLSQEDSREINESDILSIIEQYIDQADIIFTHYPGDVHHSHSLVSRSVEIATRPFRRKRWVLQCYIPTSSDQGYFAHFPANFHVILTKEQAYRKASAMDCYSSEQAPGRTKKSLLRHMENIGERIGAQFAEEFILVRAFII